MVVLKRFVAEREDRPGEAWLARFRRGRDETERWYRGQGLADPPTAAECRDALACHMPELLPHYDRVCGLVGDDDIAHRILSHYRPPPVVHGCSQAVWLGDGGPALVRNYDYALEVVSGRFELTRWSGRRVLATAQRPWGGCLDGMNEDGLVVSLTHGGGREQGAGFSIILVLRYVLETCSGVDDAVAALSRIPPAQSQNVMVLDSDGQYATLFLGPGRLPVVTRDRTCTNHQEAATEGSSSAIRQQVLLDALEDPATTLATLTGLLHRPPIYSRRAGFTTAYSAVYRPAERRVDYLWPGKVWGQSFARFEEDSYTHDYGGLTA